VARVLVQIPDPRRHLVRYYPGREAAEKRRDQGLEDAVAHGATRLVPYGARVAGRERPDRREVLAERRAGC